MAAHGNVDDLVRIACGRLDVLPERGDAQGAGAGYGVLVDSLRARDWGRMGAGGGRYAECPF